MAATTSPSSDDHQLEDGSASEGLSDVADLIASSDGRTHALVRALYAYYRDALRADAVLALRVLGRRFPELPGTEVQQLCSDAMHKARRKTGRTSANAYEEWLRQQRKPHPYPSTTKIRAALGVNTWIEATAIVFGRRSKTSAHVA